MAEQPPIAHKWEPISDLPENWQDLCRPDLHAVHRQWLAERKLIKDETKLEEFQEQLYTRWAVETGNIERLYSVDRGVTIQILEAGIEALAQIREKGLISADTETLIADQRSALEMVMDLVGSQQVPTPFYINSLHQRLTLNQATREVVDQFGNKSDKEWPQSEKGVWKKWPNNPLQPDGSIHEYCPPEHVDSEIDQLLSWWKQHDSLDVCAEVEAAWLHHRFAQIHPYIDGNGRVARALSSVVFLKEDYLVLVVRDEEHREPYLDALRAADKGDLKPLVDLFADIQRSDLQESLKLVRELRGEESVQAIEAAAVAARQSQDATMPRVAGALDRLARVVSVRFEEIAAETQRAFESRDVVVAASVSQSDANIATWPRQIREEMSRQGYADLQRPAQWAALRLGLPARPDMDIRLVVMLYPAGTQLRRYQASEVVFMQPDRSGRWGSRSTFGGSFSFDLQPSDNDAFEAIAAEFRVWLEEQITRSLSVWAASL